MEIPGAHKKAKKNAEWSRIRYNHQRDGGHVLLQSCVYTSVDAKRDQLTAHAHKKIIQKKES